MKKIYAQKRMFLFINFFSIFFAFLGLYGGIEVDKSWFSVLFISLGLSIVSMVFLINKIYYDENTIKLSFVYRKTTVKYDDVKEIFVEYDFITGAKFILNLEKKTNANCYDYFEYAKMCKKENIKNLIHIVGISKRELDVLLKHFDCDKIVVNK